MAPPFLMRALEEAKESGDTALTAEEVAKTLRRSPAWFYRNRRRLQKDHGFPPPAEGTLIWSGRRVLLWLGGDRQHSAPADPAEARADSEREAWAARAEAGLAAFIAQIPAAKRKTA